MKKSFVSILAIILVIAVFISGCSSTSDKASSDSGTKSKEFTYWYPWGGDSEKWDLNRIKQFEEKEGYKVKAVYAPPDGGIANGKLLASVTGGNPPDLVISNQYADAYSLAEKGALMPLDEILEKIGFDKSSIIDSFKLLMEHNGKTYLLPQDSNVNMLYYNVKLFKEAGLDPDKPPATLEELDEYAEKLSIVNNGKIEQLGFIPWLDSGKNPLLWGWLFGADFYNSETKKLDLKNDKLTDVYKWMQTYAIKYNPEKIKSFSSGFGGMDSPDHPFFTGKVAMTLQGNWFANLLSIYAPDVEYRAVPIPVPPGGREKSTVFGTNVWMVPKGAKNPEAAVKFILFGSQPEVLAENINLWRSFSIFKEESDAIKWFNNGDQVYKTVMEIAKSPNSGHPALTSISSQLKDELDLIRDDVIYNGTDAEPLLEELEKRLQKEVDKSN